MSELLLLLVLELECTMLTRTPEDEASRSEEDEENLSELELCSTRCCGGCCSCACSTVPLRTLCTACRTGHSCSAGDAPCSRPTRISRSGDAAGEGRRDEAALVNSERTSELEEEAANA